MDAGWDKVMALIGDAPHPRLWDLLRLRYVVVAVLVLVAFFGLLGIYGVI